MGSVGYYRTALRVCSVRYVTVRLGLLNGGSATLRHAAARFAAADVGPRAPKSRHLAARLRKPFGGLPFYAPRRGSPRPTSVHVHRSPAIWPPVFENPLVACLFLRPCTGEPCVLCGSHETFSDASHFRVCGELGMGGHYGHAQANPASSAAAMKLSVMPVIFVCAANWGWGGTRGSHAAAGNQPGASARYSGSCGPPVRGEW